MKLMNRMMIGVALCVLAVVSSVAAEEITIVGTGSGVAILGAIGEAFGQTNPDVKIIIPESIGTGGGIKAVGRDEFLLGRVARELQEKEKPYGLTYVAYAKYPVVFFVNKSVSVTNLTAQQVLDIYSGKITNWKEVGGNDASIRIVQRQEGDSSLEVLFAAFPGFKELVVTEKAKTTFSDPETEETVLNTENVIAYGSYSNVKNLDVTTLTIDGKSPTDADYPYVGTLGLVYKEANYTGNIKTFIEFATSDAANDVIISAGGIPLP